MNCVLGGTDMLKKFLSVTIAALLIFCVFPESKNGFCTTVLAADLSYYAQRNNIIKEAASHLNYRAGTYNENIFLGWAYGTEIAAGEWCAAFASYCLNQAGLSAEQYGGKTVQTYCPTWVTDLGDMFKKRSSGYIGKSGDLIFLDRFDHLDNYGNPNGIADHVGIVISSDETKVYTIEGNVGDPIGDVRTVSTRVYNITDDIILGYGKIDMRGDINGDGRITITDATNLKQYLDNPSTNININIYDVTEDGVVNIFDYDAIKLYSNGLLSTMKGYKKDVEDKKAIICTNLLGQNRSKIVFDVYAGGTESETLITAYQYHGENNQIFELVPFDDTYFYVRCLYTDKYLNINKGIDENKYGKLQIYDLCNGSQNMLFKFKKSGKKYYIISREGEYITVDRYGNLFAIPRSIPLILYQTFYIEYV